MKDPFDLQPGESMDLDDLPLITPELKREIDDMHRPMDAFMDRVDYEMNGGTTNLPVVTNQNLPAVPQVHIPGRTLIFLDYPKDELNFFAPVIDNIDRMQTKIILINIAQSPVEQFNTSMQQLGIYEWDVWGYMRPPGNLVGVMRRIIDMMEQWEPNSVFAMDTSVVPEAFNMLRPKLYRREELTPRLFTVYDGTSVIEGEEPFLLTLGPNFEILKKIYNNSYDEKPKFKAMQTYVEKAQK